MRIIGHSLLLILLIAIAGAAIYLVSKWGSGADSWTDPNGIRISRSTAYRLSSSDWLEFGLAERGPMRVLSNCAFSNPAPEATRYAVDYELLDAAGQIVLSGRYHHRAQITLLRDSNRADHESVISKTSYADPRLPGSNAEIFWIESPNLDLPGRLRIRIAEHGPAIVEIAARVYQRSEVSARKARSAWQRLNRRKRKHLARGFAISSEWLEPFEVTALARFSWRALGPRGVEDQDYEEQELLIVNDPKFERTGDASTMEPPRQMEAS